MQYLEENPRETVSLLKSCRISPDSVLPATCHTHLSCPIWENRSEKHFKKVKSANNQESNPRFLFSDPCWAPDSDILGRTFLLKYIFSWWWQDLRFSNYSIWRIKDNEEEEFFPSYHQGASYITWYNHTPQRPPPIALWSLTCQGDYKATLKKQWLTNSPIDINNVNA